MSRYINAGRLNLNKMHLLEVKESKVGNRYKTRTSHISWIPLKMHLCIKIEHVMKLQMVITLV